MIVQAFQCYQTLWEHLQVGIQRGGIVSTSRAPPSFFSYGGQANQPLEHRLPLRRTYGSSDWKR